LISTIETYDPTYRAWATRLRKASSQRRRSARLTFENGSSSWPTAQAYSHDPEVSNVPGQVKLDIVAKNWPTPSTAPEAPNTNSNTVNGPTSLGEAATLWQTPGTDSFRSRGGDRKDEQGLDQMARTWSTPRTSDTNGAGSHGDGGLDLRTQIETWATPKVSTSTYTRDGGKKGRERLSLPGQVMQTDGNAGLQTGRVLNPRFVEALMGWPSGATDYESSETAWSPWLLQMRCVLSQLGWS
jgi:DNA (cytosine-5)-methyltransferase 1